ncbi:MAG: hypothetical protein GX879_03295 [Bacteroidales bacterium]|nr:hypothetical protein [Bacteroidales bacterium]
MLKARLNLRKVARVIASFAVVMLVIGQGAFAQESGSNTEAAPTETAVQTDTLVKQSAETINKVIESGNSYSGFVFLVVVIVLLIAYIFAIIRTRKGQMYTFANWWDFIIILIAGFGTSVGLGFILYEDATILHWLLLSVGIIAFAVSLFLSIKINKGNGLNIALSIGAKLFVFIVVLVVVVMWILALAGKKSDEASSTSTSYDHAGSGYLGRGLIGALVGLLLANLIASKWKMPKPIEK